MRWSFEGCCARAARGAERSPAPSVQMNVRRLITYPLRAAKGRRAHPTPSAAHSDASAGLLHFGSVGSTGDRTVRLDKCEGGTPSTGPFKFGLDFADEVIERVLADDRLQPRT